MDGRAASLTITDKIPYFLEAGVQPIVLSAITGLKDQRFPHEQFLAWGPAAFRFDFRHWIANKYGRGFIYKLLTRTVSILLAPLIAIEKLLLGYSSQWSWAIPAFIRGYILIRRGKVDVIYSIGSAWSAHLAGVWLKKATGLPLISEVHDPLVIRKDPNDQGFEKPKNRDARFRHYLEAQLCKYSDYVWWFTQGALHYAKVRNPNLNTPGNAVGFVVMPGANPPGTIDKADAHQYSEHLNLSHFGSLANDRSLSIILKAANSLFAKYPDARKHLRIHAYGAPLDSLSQDAIKQYDYSDILLAHGRLERDPVTGMSGREQVAQKMQQADVFLDTLGFSGFNTAMQAIECDLPIVTMAGEFMRGRLAAGILQRINLPELITHSTEEYIALAVRLAQDSTYRASIVAQIQANRDVLFNDVLPVRELEAFLSAHCRS